MNNESEKETEYQALLFEFNNLIDFAILDNKRQFAEINAWFEAELDKIIKEIEAPSGQPVYTAQELSDLYFKKQKQRGDEFRNTVLKIGDDAKAKIQDTHFAGRAEELMKEINADEWKKYFGDL